MASNKYIPWAELLFGLFAVLHLFITVGCAVVLGFPLLITATVTQLPAAYFMLLRRISMFASAPIGWAVCLMIFALSKTSLGVVSSYPEPVTLPVDFLLVLLILFVAGLLEILLGVTIVISTVFIGVRRPPPWPTPMLEVLVAISLVALAVILDYQFMLHDG